jgi:deoxycytidylate deaminase
LDPEVFIGIIAPLGSEPLDFVDDLEGALATWGYSTTVTKLSSLLISQAPANEHADARIRRLIDAGDHLCTTAQSPSAVAVLALGDIRARRLSHTGSSDTPYDRHAFIIDSLKRPGEVDLLRRVYGDRFLALGLESAIEKRVDQVASLLTSHVEWDSAHRDEESKRLIDLDSDETTVEYGQGVARSFPLSDYFLEEGEGPARVIDLLFGEPSIAPKAGERAMFIANATAASSLSASRRVGAAILDAEDRLLAIGRNEVPPTEAPDIARGFDSNKQDRRQLLNDTLKRLDDLGMLAAESAQQLREGQDEFLDRSLLELRESSLLRVIEYQRPVHAEMDAITDAARRGVSLRGSTLYVTSYPCHLCAKHFSSAGIDRSYFIEPYPKSRTEAMFTASASAIRPFHGVAPRSYQRLFENRVLPDADARGMIMKGSKKQATPLVGNPFDVTYLEREKLRLGSSGGST